MNIWHRRIYFSLMVAIFLVVAPILVLYAMGWRYNVLTSSVEKRTAIAVATTPRGATLEINGKTVNRTTPTTINNLVSGSYNISIKKDGFFPWYKTVFAYPDKVTRLSEVRLIPNPGIPPSPVQYQDLFSLAPSSARFAIYADGGIAVYDSSMTLLRTHQNDITPQDLVWSPDEQYLAIRSTDGSITVLAVDSPDLTYAVSDFTDQSVIQYTWSPSESAILYLLTENSLLRINLFQGTTTIVREDAEHQYITDTIYQRTTDNSRALLNATHDTTTILPIPPENFVTFSHISDTSLLAHDVTSKRLHYINMQTGVIETFPNKVAHHSWIEESDLMVYNNATELWLYDWLTSSHNLIVRTSDEILQSYLVAENTHIAYSTNDGHVKVIEVIGPQRNSYQYDITSVDGMVASYDGQGLFAYGNDALVMIGL